MLVWILIGISTLIGTIAIVGTIKFIYEMNKEKKNNN